MKEVKLPKPKSALAESYKEIKGNLDEDKEWKYDPKGYFLIRVNKEKRQIEVGHCKKNNIVEVMISGKNPQEVYYTIIREGLISSLQHAAYLGKELQKAYVALVKNVEYVQDDEEIRY